MDVIARHPDCDGQAADTVSAYVQVKLEDASRLLRILKSECPDEWIRLPRHKWPKSWSNIEDPVVFLEWNLYGHPIAGHLWERRFEDDLLELGWEKLPNWEYLIVHRQQRLFLSVHVDDIKMDGKKLPRGRNWWRLLILMKQHHFLTMYVWDVLDVNANRTKLLFEQHKEMFESRISAGATEKLPGWEKPHAKTVSWSHDMEGHAQKCVEIYCELANKKGRATVQSFKSLLGWSSISRRWNWKQLENHQKYAHKLSWSACNWHEFVDLTFNGQSINLPDQSQNGPEHLTNVWQDSFYPFITQVTTDNVAMCSDFGGNLDDSKSTSGGILCILEVEHLFPLVGGVRSKHQCPPVLQNQKSFRWMLDCEWMDHLLSTCVTWWLKCCFRQTAPRHQFIQHLQTDARCGDMLGKVNDGQTKPPNLKKWILGQGRPKSAKEVGKH